MTPEKLTYQTTIGIAGQFYRCVESYEAIHRRLVDTAMRIQVPVDDDADEVGGAVSLAPMVELTLAGEFGPCRASVAPQAISIVLEVPPEHQAEVTFAEVAE